MMTRVTARPRRFARSDERQPLQDAGFLRLNIAAGHRGCTLFHVNSFATLRAVG